ncbi:unnamed protein product [Cyclocybe aegerita]|uniref:Uncharacterized protein n=1 Tax=Cyclocybe aegerita TaxID=1973307 RepID=A0A8S0WP11_CYCAE|nr:unnamed protein product [Cyclocybe aegerita]
MLLRSRDARWGGRATEVVQCLHEDVGRGPHVNDTPRAAGGGGLKTGAGWMVSSSLEDVSASRREASEKLSSSPGPRIRLKSVAMTAFTKDVIWAKKASPPSMNPVCGLRNGGGQYLEIARKILDSVLDGSPLAIYKHIHYAAWVLSELLKDVRPPNHEPYGSNA